MPIIARIVESLEPLVDERIVVTNDDSLRDLPDTKLVYDPSPHAGVLPALAQGLSMAQGAVCLAVACDMPFVSRPLFEHLLAALDTQDADVVIPRTAGFLEPMHAVYRRVPVLQAIEGALARGEQRMISFFDRVRVYEVGEDEWRHLDAQGRAFFNVNTAEDLARARSLV